MESGVGAHLANAAAAGECELFYRRDRNREVDFVVRVGSSVLAIEVKRGAPRGALPGVQAFAQSFPTTLSLVVGGDGASLHELLSQPVRHWITR